MNTTPARWTESEVQAIRKQLDTLLRSEFFDQSNRQSRFLSYVVEEELSGRGKRLNQYAIASDVFDRDASFDPLVDSIVRVEARRLRSKLTEYYAEIGQNDPIIIKLPKGHYRIAVQGAHGEDTLPELSSGRVRMVSLIAKKNVLADPAGKPTVAVLPFDNLSGDPEQEYFSDGITEDIITDLSKISGLLVVSRHSTFVYKGKSLNCREISNDLAATHVLEGSVRKSGTRIRISAQLINALTDKHLWAERYDRDLDDIFAIQDDVSRQIVNALQLRLTQHEQQRLGHIGTDSTEAHDLYLRAQEQFYRFTHNSINHASTLLCKSIDVDPTYAEAYGWQSRVLVFAFIAGVDASKQDTIDQALMSARRAVELDDLLPLAHASLGWTLMWNRAIEDAIAEVSKAIELDPNFADGYCWQSFALSSAGRGEEALESIEYAVRLNPYYTVTYLMGIGIAYFTLGQYEMALNQFERGIRRNPNFIFNHLFKTSTLALLGRAHEAELAKSKLMAFDQYKRVVDEAFFYNDERLLGVFTEGLAKAGL